MFTFFFVAQHSWSFRIIRERWSGDCFEDFVFKYTGISLSDISLDRGLSLSIFIHNAHRWWSKILLSDIALETSSVFHPRGSSLAEQVGFEPEPEYVIVIFETQRVTDDKTWML